MVLPQSGKKKKGVGSKGLSQFIAGQMQSSAKKVWAVMHIKIEFRKSRGNLVSGVKTVDTKNLRS